MKTASPLTPRRMPRQQRSAATVDALLEAAARVFREQGYRRATTNRIAEVAGASVGSLYEYFPNKDALLAALARRHMHEGLALAARVLEGASSGQADLATLAQGGLQAMLALHERDIDLHRILFEETPLPAWLRMEVVAMSGPLVGTLAGLLERSPEVRVPDVRLAAVMVVEVTEALTHGFVLHPPAGVSRERFVQEGARIIRGYLMGAGRE